MVGSLLVVHNEKSVTERVVVSAAPAHAVAARPVGSTSLSLSASAAPSAAPQLRVLAEGEAEICGIGIVKREDLERPEFVAKHFPEPALKGNQWFANLRSSNDEAVRAAGHYLAATLSWELDKDAVAIKSIEACGSDGNCVARLIQKDVLGGPNATREIDSLVDQAVTTKNAFVYAIAVQACRAWDTTSRRTGRCQLITLDRWTQLDSDNFIPWLFRAAQAQAQGDTTGRREALYRASIASTSRIAGQELLGRTLGSMPSDLSELERWRLQVGAMGVESAWVIPPFQTVTGYCTADAIRDANVSQICAGLAAVLADKSNTLMERALGIRMGERIGWPAERLTALRSDRDAFYQVTAIARPTEALDCASLHRQNDEFARRARLGELAFGHALIAESREPADALAKQFAETMTKFARVAASSAAASAATAEGTGLR